MPLPLIRPHRYDIGIALVGLAGGLTGVRYDVFSVVSVGPYSPVALIGLLAMCGAELLRRGAPGWCLGIGTAAVLWDSLTGGLLAVLLMFTDVVYAAVLYGGPRLSRAVLRGSVALTVAVTVGALAWLRDPQALALGVLAAAVTATPAWTAAIVRGHRESAAHARLRAEQTALLAEMDRVQAVTDERARMARELHDVVANHLSAIAIHSTAALTLDDPDAGRDALTIIRENSTQGLAEMRRLIGILRADDPDAAPEALPGLDSLDALIARAARSAAGRLRITAEDRRADLPRPPAPVDLAAYRIVQESLTNALKHATPGEVRVRLDQDDAQSLTVCVTSPNAAAGHDTSRPRAPGSGAGLTGMRERVALLGGTFSAGPHGEGDRWQVLARLPLTEGTTTA
ncbi:sensor histidine kinase [Streptomyces xiamenensis]|uniref:histidine kinase n=1 Tax=Streptomyces xiamenensis TaxID=408015 RepID=A0A0F7FZH1_9ACTN|nr:MULTISPECIES: histidine kinase [Streptomyces]AKG45532.1 sensor histidine kinase [Streptomyces xiamenensis]